MVAENPYFRNQREIQELFENIIATSNVEDAVYYANRAIELMNSNINGKVRIFFIDPWNHTHLLFTSGNNEYGTRFLLKAIFWENIY